MQPAMNEVEVKTKAAKAASKKLAYLATDIKNKALFSIADELIANEKTILAANRLDYAEGEKAGMSAAMLDRLLLTSERIQAISSDVFHSKK